MSDTDPTTPWFEFISYLRCCESLNIIPSVSRFMAYNNYYQNYGKQSKSS
jgi:hypothetical protein